MNRKTTSWILWIVVAMAFIATALSFLDRQVLSISIIQIKEDFHITDGQYGWINTCFLISYAIMFTVGGILIDRFGSRIGLAWSVGVWSLSTVLHSAAQNAAHFGVCRFVLGLGEGGAFPGVIKAVSEWVPKKWQASANGIVIGGSALGAVIAPPLCVWLISLYGWKGVFIVTGLIGLVWTVLWLLLPKPPVVEAAPSKSTNWKELGGLLKIKDVWVFIAMRFMLDPIFYFYMFWIPKYLNEARGADLARIGDLFWIPFLALGISNMLGGWVSDKILKKTGNINFSRKVVMGVAALLTAAVLPIKLTGSVEASIVLMVIAFFAHGLWITNYITAIGDIFGKSRTSTIVGFSGSAGALSSLIINPFMGVIIAKYSYDPMWIYAGIMYSVAFIVFVVLIPKIKARNLVIS